MRRNEGKTNPLQLRIMRLKYLEEANKDYIDLRLALSQAEEELSPSESKDLVISLARKTLAQVTSRIKRLEELLGGIEI